MDVLTQLVEFLDLDPFIYLLVVIGGVVVWIYGNAVADFALAGPAAWIRRIGLLVASLAVVLFAWAVKLTQ